MPYYEVGERGEDRISSNIRSNLIFCPRCGEVMEKDQDGTVCWSQFLLDIKK